MIKQLIDFLRRRERLFSGHTLVFFLGCCLGSAGNALASDPTSRSLKKGAEQKTTVFLEDPEIWEEKPLILPPPSPPPQVKERTRPKPLPTPTPRMDPDEEEKLIRESQRHRSFSHPSPPLSTQGISPSSGLFVGQTVPVPTEYAPARWQTSVGSGGVTTVVIPATPTRFAPLQTGITLGSEGMRSTELRGFMDYGSPIRTLVPIFDAQGRVIGYQAIESPNRILQPVIRTIEVR